MSCLIGSKACSADESLICIREVNSQVLRDFSTLSLNSVWLKSTPLNNQADYDLFFCCSHCFFYSPVILLHVKTFQVKQTSVSDSVHVDIILSFCLSKQTHRPSVWSTMKPQKVLLIISASWLQEQQKTVQWTQSHQRRTDRETFHSERKKIWKWTFEIQICSHIIYGILLNTAELYSSGVFGTSRWHKASLTGILTLDFISVPLHSSWRLWHLDLQMKWKLYFCLKWRDFSASQDLDMSEWDLKISTKLLNSLCSSFFLNHTFFSSIQLSINVLLSSSMNSQLL